MRHGHWWAIGHFALGHKAIWKIGYLVQKVFLCKNSRIPTQWLFISTLYFEIVWKVAKKLRIATQWSFYFWRSFKTWQKIADSNAMTFRLVFGDRLKIAKKSRNSTQWPFFADRLKDRKRLRERAMENFSNKNGPRLQKGWELLVYDYMKALPSSIKKINFSVILAEGNKEVATSPRCACMLHRRCLL